MNITTTEQPHSTLASAAAQKPKAARKPRVAPSKTCSARKAQKTAKGRHKAPPASSGSKTAQVLDLLRRPGGATLQELQKATGWLPHSVRGFLSGALRKQMGLALASTKDPGTPRRYSLPR